MAETKALMRFTERSYQALYEDFRVFIQGVDVTPWVMGSLTITRTNRDGPGSASFTLDNAMDRFVITAENLQGKWRDTTDRYSEAAKHAIYLYKTGQNEVTQDRISELASVLFSRNLDIVQARTTNEIARDQNNARRRRNLRDIKRDDSELSKIEAQELRIAASDTVQDMPAEAILNDTTKVMAAISDQLVAQGLSVGEADETAVRTVENRKKQLVDAGRQRPAGDGPAQETNPDQSSSERKGRHRRKKFMRNVIDWDTGDARWPLQVRSAVLHKNDPVRIFLHNPFTQSNFWLFGFTGFVSEYPTTYDYLTGQSTIQVQCYDIKSLLQKMRVQQNTVFPTREPAPLFKDRSSIFADLIAPNGDRLTHVFANNSFENTVAILTTGTTIDRRGQGRRFGVGDLTVGKVVTYPSDESDDPNSDVNRTTLEEWHTLCLNGPAELMVQDEIANTTPLTSADVEELGRGTTSDGPYAPTRAYVHFLLPRAGTAAYNLTQTTFDAGSEQRDFATRFEIISDFCARLDYEFTVLPNGDLAFEFPMYDFMPEDFGDYKPMFEVDYHLMSGNVADESGEIVSAIVVSGGPPRSDLNKFQDAPLKLVPRGVIQSSLIASRVGVTVEEVSLPFVQNSARLRSLGFIEFQKRLAAANQMDMEFGFRPFWMPNRPVYNIVEQRMGLTSSVTDTMQLFGACNTSGALRFIRHVRPDGTFRFVTGGDSMPISYRKIFPGNVKSVGNAKVGVRTSLEQDGDDTALTNQKVDEVTSPGTNDDRPPSFIDEARPGTFFSLTPTTRKVVERLAQTFSDRPFLLNTVPQVNGTAFGIRARTPDGKRLYSDEERMELALAAKRLDYILIDTRERFRFEQRRSGQPTFIVRPEDA